jgi:AcrR family transcriptional regulator
MKNEERRRRAIESILEASLAALKAGGYSKFRTIEVSKRTGMSEGTLFRYYPTKLDLVCASLERALDAHVQRLVAEFAKLAQPTNRLSLLWMLWHLLAHEDFLWTYELGSAASTDAKLQAAIGPVYEAHTAAVDLLSIAAMEAFGIPEWDLLKATNLATWSMQALVGRDLGRGETGAQERLVPFLASIADRAYGPLVSK